MVFVLLALGLMAAPVPAHAASPTLVALGDSYASGVGTYVYYDDGTECYRSPFAYSSLLAGAFVLSVERKGENVRTSASASQ